jgi:hypothetical protein
MSRCVCVLLLPALGHVSRPLGCYRVMQPHNVFCCTAPCVCTTLVFPVTSRHMSSSPVCCRVLVPLSPVTFLARLPTQVLVAVVRLPSCNTDIVVSLSAPTVISQASTSFASTLGGLEADPVSIATSARQVL